jgi:glycosyltransferase involved in cell wall biosynthesis
MPADQKILLFVGRLAVEKNMETLFEAAAIAMHENPAVRLWIVGDGPYREACQRIARKLAIGDRVKFVGFAKREDVDPYYAAADLFVFASITETQGLVVQEAMTYGLPPVLVDGGGAGAGVESGVNGILVRNDAEELGSEIVRVLADDDLHARLSDQAMRSARSGSPAVMAERVVQVYESVLAAREMKSIGTYASVQ